MDPQREPGIRIDQVFLIESHFSHRSDFLSRPPSPDAIDLDMKVEIRAFGGPDQKTAGVAVKVSTNPEDKEALYQFSVQMGALVSAIEGEENFPPYDYVIKAGATFLYPFLRECIANLTARARFGPVYIKPFNVVQAVSNKESKRIAAKGRKKSKRRPRH